VKISGPENYKEICMTKEEHAGRGVGLRGVERDTVRGACPICRREKELSLILEHEIENCKCKK
jgi:hypothetical protein